MAQVRSVIEDSIPDGRRPEAMAYDKVVILDSVILYPEHRERLNEIAREVVEHSTCQTEEEVLERVDGADCVISCWVDVSNRVIAANPQLKTVAFWTHAFEHRIDRDFALSRNIHVPAIPDYGTDAVAELAFIGLLHGLGNRRCPVSGRVAAQACAAAVGDSRVRLAEGIAAAFTNDVRRFSRNWKDALKGSWVHEYIKAGTLRITSPDEFPQDTLKGLTVGMLVGDYFSQELLDIVASGFRMNVIYSLGDVPHTLQAAYRPIDALLSESHVIVYDSRTVTPGLVERIKNSQYLSVVDVATLDVQRNPLRGKRLGIVGLGRIGGRVAQIAADGFGMDVSYHSRTRKPDLERRYCLTAKSMEEVLAESDIVTFHLPHVGAEGVVTAKMVEMIPPGTTVVNVSVGSIFEDQNRLLGRFVEGDLNGYVDVYETLPPRELLRKHQEHLIATYRLGWRTKSTIGLKTHKLIARLKEGLDRV